MEHLSAPDVLLLTAQMHKASPRAGQPVPGMPRRRMSGVAEAEFEAEAEAEAAAISRADGAPGEAATKLHAAKMSAARMNAARLLNGQSNDGLRTDAVHANDVALPTDDHLFGF